MGAGAVSVASRCNGFSGGAQALGHSASVVALGSGIAALGSRAQA